MLIPMTHSNSDQVNARLHNLRGEAFRHQLNLTGKRRPLVQGVGPSLPPSLYSSEVLFGIDKLPPNDVFTNTQIPGPPPPRSWLTSVTPKHTNPSSPEWRSNALSFMFRHSPCSSKLYLYNNPHSVIPSFFHLCLHTILQEYGGIPSDMYRYIPRHILREYVRHGVIYQLISKEEMLQIWNIDRVGAIDGELLVSGSITTPALSQNKDSAGFVIEDWDAEENYSGQTDAPPPMHTFIALSAAFHYSHIQLLPISITHLALMNIQKISLHWLPTQLPSLAVLDLSYNSWINDACALGINWRKWVDLEAVALRGCPIDENQIKLIGQEISGGRLLEVEVVVER